MSNIDPNITFGDEFCKLENHINKLAHGNKDLFEVKSANEWIDQAKNRPIPKMLFGELWYENELCILFSDTNLGKSILAVQIAKSISEGKPIEGFPLEAQKQTVLYFDFELNDKQFENRYSVNYENHYRFNDNFLRIEINPDAEFAENQTFEEQLIDSLENTIIKRNSKILIIDNITYLRAENEKAKDALPLMKQLKLLKNKYELSILVLAHTPKRDLSKPITRNDISGSKMLINFCDSSFTIGESASDKNMRYIKQIKVRASQFVFDSENVINCLIDKPYNFVQFEVKGYGREKEHLKEPSERDINLLNDSVIELTNQGLSLREIAMKLDISHMKVARILKKQNCNKP